MIKKIVSIILAAAMVLSFAGCANQTERKPYEPKLVSEKTLIKDKMPAPVHNSSQIPLGSEYAKIYKESEGYKYVSYEFISEEEVSVYALPEEELSKEFQAANLLEDLKNSEGAKRLNKEKEVLATAEFNAQLIAKTLTQEEGLIVGQPTISENTYISYNGMEWDNSAFGDIFDKGMTPTDYMKEQGLKLILDEPVVKQIIFNSDVAKCCWACCAIVEADVICVKNGGAFQSIKWIPKAGRAKTMTFAFTYWNYKADTGEHGILISDIAVIGQK